MSSESFTFLTDFIVACHSLLTATSRHLDSAIQKCDDFRSKMAQFPPITSGKHRETKSFAAIMDETVGFMD